MRIANAIEVALVVVAAIAASACGGSTDTGLGGNGSGGNGGGNGGCSGGPPPAHCEGACGAPGGGMQCVDGQWSCPPLPMIACPYDAGQDSAPPRDAGSIACGSSTCDANTEYCQISGGGAQPIDGGSNMSYGCVPLPAMPCEAGTGCACISNGCSCTDDGGAITNECFYP